MASNLTSMGVSSTASEGLTTLANKILTIPSGVSYDDILLSSNKSILSQYDNDKVTLTVQLYLNGNPIAVEDVPITFKQGSTTIGTVNTDSTGLATLTNAYTSIGAGEITFTATTNNISDNVVINDCLLYRATVTSSDTFNLTLPSNFKVTGTVTKTSSSSSYCYYKFTNFDAGSLRENGSISVRRVNNSPFADNNTSIITTNTPTVLTYTRQGNTHTVTANNQQASGTNSTTQGTFNGIHIQRYNNVTDLKIEAL